MRLALESRTDMLEMIQPFADFDWILAHKVLEDDVYKEWYKESSNVKFVDNSVNELDEPLSVEQLKQVFEEVGGTYVVAPDWLGDARRTVEGYKECVSTFGDESSVVGVVQGSTFEEALKCVEVYKGIIAVPYDICSNKEDPPWLMGLRRVLVVCNIPGDRLVHLLGFTGFEELFWYKGRQNILSIDTGAPVMLGLQEKDILDGLEDKKKDTFGRMEGQELTQTGYTAICRNLALLRKEIS